MSKQALRTLKGLQNGGLHQVASLEDTLSHQYDYLSTTQTITGSAPSGLGTHVAGWQLSKITYDSEGRPLSITHPMVEGEPVAPFKSVWDDRAAYTEWG
ncbi:hypothetical protein [Magnetococcus sp. PR-3]|uniref:hypothetical protein n=1 Tax=Magnetococcus sp. PR-3 TaxID=3120355 RepID=UPI002FCE3220